MPRRNHRRKCRNHQEDWRKRMERLVNEQEKRIRDLESIVYADDGTEKVATGIVIVAGNRYCERKVVLESDQAVEWE